MADQSTSRPAALASIQDTTPTAPRIGRRGFTAGALLGTSALTGVGWASLSLAQEPVLADPTPAKPGDVAFRNPPEARRNALGDFALTVGYADIDYLGQDCRLLTYFDMNDPTDRETFLTGARMTRPVVSPTLRVEQAPGVCAQFGVDLVNSIPFNPDNYFNWLYFGDDTPHGFAVTNLHTHGLHVDPDGLGDNVLIEVWPQGTPANYSAFCGTGPDFFVSGTRGYRYTMPPFHPVGTYWYHPHKHGSTAYQVANGMAGALIVEDSETNLQTILEVDPADRDRFEKIIVIQQVPLFAPTVGDSAATLPSPVQPPDLKPGQVYVDALALYGMTAGAGQFEEASPIDPDDKKHPKAFLTVNGQYQPTITMAPNEIQSWRVVNTCYSQSAIIRWSFQPVPTASAAGTNTDSAAEPPIAYAIATDGNPLPASLIGMSVDSLTEPALGEVAILGPGQRVDLLVQAPAAAGTFQMQIEQAYVPSPDFSPVFDPLPLLYVSVAAAASGDTYTPPTTMPHPSAFLGLPRPEPVPSYLNSLPVPADPTQVAGDLQPTCFSFQPVGNSAVNGSSFNPAGPQRTLPLDQTSVWYVGGEGAGHVYHVHVNPFVLLTRTTKPQDKDPVLQQYPVTLVNGAIDGIFRDTMVIYPMDDEEPFPVRDCGLPGSIADRPSVMFASYQRDFCGNFVMHCHILDHEDTGMMEWVQVLKDGEICADPTETGACTAEVNPAEPV